MAFHEVRFPESISWGAVGGPEWRTTIVELANGFEQRIQSWENEKIVWDVTQAVKSDDDFETLLDFFQARRGRFHGFRFKDWMDYTLVQQQTSPQIGDGYETEFQIVKRYETTSPPPSSSSVNPYVRTIKKIRGGTGDPITTVDSPGTIVRVDGVAQTEGVDFTLDYDTGIITFTVAPDLGEVVDFTGEFDIPARFDVDRLAATLEDVQATTWGGITIRAIRL